MDILIAVLYVVEVVSCLLLALVVMLQKPKEGGLGGLAGGMGEAVFGADAGNVLIKVTIWLGAIFLANTLLLARFTSKAHAPESLMADQAVPRQTEPQNAKIDATELEKAVKQVGEVEAAKAATAATNVPAAVPVVQTPAAAPAATTVPVQKAPAVPAAPGKPATPVVPEKPTAPVPAPAAK